MPYKSDAQRRFFHAAQQRGEISPQVVSEYDKMSKGKKLPERLHPSQPKNKFAKTRKLMRKS